MKESLWLVDHKLKHKLSEAAIDAWLKHSNTNGNGTIKSYKNAVETISDTVDIPQHWVHTDDLCIDCGERLTRSAPGASPACIRCNGVESKTTSWVECSVQDQIQLLVNSEASTWLFHAMDPEASLRKEKGVKLETHDGELWHAVRREQFGDDDPRHLLLALTCDGFGKHRKSLFAFVLEILNSSLKDRGQLYLKILFAVVEGGNIQCM